MQHQQKRLSSHRTISLQEITKKLKQQQHQNFNSNYYAPVTDDKNKGAAASKSSLFN